MLMEGRYAFAGGPNVDASIHTPGVLKADGVSLNVLQSSASRVGRRGLWLKINGDSVSKYIENTLMAFVNILIRQKGYGQNRVNHAKKAEETNKKQSISTFTFTHESDEKSKVFRLASGQGPGGSCSRAEKSSSSCDRRPCTALGSWRPRLGTGRGTAGRPCTPACPRACHTAS